MASKSYIQNMMLTDLSTITEKLQQDNFFPTPRNSRNTQNTESKNVTPENQALQVPTLIITNGSSKDRKNIIDDTASFLEDLITGSSVLLTPWNNLFSFCKRISSHPNENDKDMDQIYTDRLSDIVVSVENPRRSTRAI